MVCMAFITAEFLRDRVLARAYPRSMSRDGLNVIVGHSTVEYHRILFRNLNPVYQIPMCLSIPNLSEYESFFSVARLYWGVVLCMQIIV